MILYKVQKYFPTDDMNKFIECDIYSVDDFERESINRLFVMVLNHIFVQVYVENVIIL